LYANVPIVVLFLRLSQKSNERTGTHRTNSQRPKGDKSESAIELYDRIIDQFWCGCKYRYL